MIFDFIEKHKIAFVAICSIVLFAGYMGVTAAIKASRGDDAGPAAIESVETDGAGAAQGADGATGMTSAQRGYVKDYDGQAESIVAQLASVPWRGVDGKGHLTFTSTGAFTETLPADSGKKQVEGTSGSIAIVDVDGHAVGTTQDGSETVTSFIGLLDDGTYAIFHLTRKESPQDEAANPVMYLDSDALGGGGYTSAHAWTDLDIQGVGEEVAAAVDGHSKKLETALSGYVKAYHSSCGTAAWDNTISINYDMKTVSIGFVLTSSVLAADGTPESEYIVMTYDMQTETFEGNEA